MNDIIFIKILAHNNKIALPKIGTFIIKQKDATNKEYIFTTLTHSLDTDFISFLEEYYKVSRDEAILMVGDYVNHIKLSFHTKGYYMIEGFGLLYTWKDVVYFETITERIEIVKEKKRTFIERNGFEQGASSRVDKTFSSDDYNNRVKELEGNQFVNGVSSQNEQSARRDKLGIFFESVDKEVDRIQRKKKIELETSKDSLGAIKSTTTTTNIDKTVVLITPTAPLTSPVLGDELAKKTEPEKAVVTKAIIEEDKDTNLTYTYAESDTVKDTSDRFLKGFLIIMAATLFIGGIYYMFIYKEFKPREMVRVTRKDALLESSVVKIENKASNLTPKTNKYYVVAGTFTDPANAHKEAIRTKGMNYRSQVLKTSETKYFVTIGNFMTSDSAKLLSRSASSRFNNLWITKH